MKDVYTEKVDFLTNCYMKDGLKPFLDKLFAEYKAYGKEFSLLLLDVDHFKPFNDKYGHLDGDQVLKYFSSTLRLGLADMDATIFRFGGDEFILVFPEKNTRQVSDVAKQLQGMLKERPFLLGGKMFKMSFSGGIISCASDGDNVDAILANADKAMYASKKLGRGRATIYGQVWLQYLLRALRVMGVVASIALVAAIVIAIAMLLTRGPVSSKTFKFEMKMPAFRAAATAKAGKGAAFPVKQKRATVHLLSGAKIKGAIIKETPVDIELKLTLDMGEGSVTLKKSIIKKIEREE